MDDLTSLNPESAAKMLDRLLSQLGTWREAVVAGERRVAGFRKMIDALVEMFPELEDRLPAELDEGEPARPRGAAAALNVLQERPNRWYSVGSVVQMLDTKDWLPKSSNPGSAVRTALERLVEKNEIEKNRSTNGAVIYRFHDPDADKEPF